MVAPDAIVFRFPLMVRPVSEWTSAMLPTDTSDTGLRRMCEFASRDAAPLALTIVAFCPISKVTVPPEPTVNVLALVRDAVSRLPPAPPGDTETATRPLARVETLPVRLACAPAIII